MATAKLSLMILLFMISLFTGGVVADIRNWEIKSSSLIFIDNFEFIGTEGRLELKVTNISFFNKTLVTNHVPRHTINNTFLSNMSFFLSDRILLNNMSTSCQTNDLHVRYKLYTVDNLEPDADSFNLIFSEFHKPGDYMLYFENCARNYVYINMKGQSSMYNLRGEDHTPDYLSPRKDLVTKLFYPLLALMHFSLACLWAFHIPKLKTPKKTMCWLLVLVPYLRAWSLICGMLYNIYIMKVGCADCWPSILLSSASDFLSEAPVATFLVLFSTGLVMVKPSLHLGDKILILLVIFVQLTFVTFNVLWKLYVPPGRVILYLYPGCFTILACITTGLFFHQLTVKFTLKFLREVARGKFTNATFANQTPLSLLTFAEILKSLFSTHGFYTLFQVSVVSLLEVFLLHLPLIVTLKELAAMGFYAKVACYMRSENWILKLSRKDGKYDAIKKDDPFQAYDDIEKAVPLLHYDDDLIYSYLEKEWDGGI